jgi:hypothetical protein
MTNMKLTGAWSAACASRPTMFAVWLQASTNQRSPAVSNRTNGR